MPRIALLSVSNKQGLVPLAIALSQDYGFQLLSSGGTAKVLEEAGLEVTRVAEHTEAPEILQGRVKTLHPKVHGGILAKRDDPNHQKDLSEQNIAPIDLVIVNLYPFEETIKDPNVNWENAIENIDIGGPAMVRAAAKNNAHVSVLTSPTQYEPFINALKDGITSEMRKKLALEAFQHTASYDIAISNWLAQKLKSNKQNSSWLQAFPLKQSLRYGENPHQTAAWYSNTNEGWGGATQLQGKELSTNNLLDLEAALSTVMEFGYEKDKQRPSISPAAVVIKHTNPCGVAISENTSKAMSKALEADPISAFGGIVAINQEVDSKTAEVIQSLFLECVVAPSFSKEAMRLLKGKKNLRLLELTSNAIRKSSNTYVRSILGGVLVQELDNDEIQPETWSLVTKRAPSRHEEEDLKFAWKIARHVRSNAIVVASNGQSLGIGAGQMNRVGAAYLALKAAKEKAKGAVLASDGFLPFNDTVRLASEHGITAIIQPGGSVRDNESIETCNDLDISMIFTGKRHFLH
ncbi:bifunctional phosphoribosylaminoimidazolecarboxamide formyltransferase/IMP cyclohydrolase [Prochlorococcus sp. MIT 1300]|uniref:bifunctional phosphoribosylaminoimidazolecarboxamide formyltransferase/IMP cyclohydrolase n=1 Tax=Prochlorococcus sp. MIT 1300 TaxID=3096218 RepID=UPI002A76263F|nr:bifunctional phosphoribosylaminoimidazolecarboxamide formyltransferase/IMP cyclohydrolase [Prochlorococcus sp. MIT 1300]